MRDLEIAKASTTSVASSLMGVDAIASVANSDFAGDSRMTAFLADLPTHCMQTTVRMWKW
jgi:hypothetical protein